MKITVRDPYKVLGIRENASEEDIKVAYKRLVKKYHPDQYANNPLADLAQEKLREINEAYDSLMKNKSNKQSYNQNYSWNNNQSSDIYSRVRALIERGSIVEAEQLLETIQNRNAEWNFLKGIILLRRGWYDQAHHYLKIAVSMDPRNSEYVSALNNISHRMGGYRQYGDSRGYRRDPSFCEICQCLICADCCCECAGGDLISCC